MILTKERKVLRYVIIVSALLSFPSDARADLHSTTPTLKLINGGVSKDGHIKLEWDLNQPTEVEVQQSGSRNFDDAKMIYHGYDKATFISGLSNGTYYYRIRAVNGTWSEPVALIVKHHSLRLAFVLFSLGAVVFALTVFIVVKGAYQASTE